MKDTFLAFLYHLFSFVILLSVLDAFFLVSEVPVDYVEMQSANHKYRRFSIVEYFTLPNSLFNNKTTVTNQCENETNKYAEKNRLHGYRFFLVGVVSKVKLFRLRETYVISSYILTSLSIEYLNKFRFFGL